jgi:hypothetical protein
VLIALALGLAAQNVAYSPSDPSPACSASETVSLTPADRLQALDDFRASLSRVDRQRLDRALPRGGNDGIRQCDAGEGSRASCEAAAYMPALRRTGLMPRFRATICEKKPAADRRDRAR